jgi:Fe-S-cluster-containing dehydrogenase component
MGFMGASRKGPRKERIKMTGKSGMECSEAGKGPGGRKGPVISRRGFLKGVCSVLAASAVTPPETISGSSGEGTAHMSRRWAMIIDLSRCMGCQSCVSACKSSKDPDCQPLLTRIESRLVEEDDGIRPLFVPVMCFHCENAACMKACSNGAIKRLGPGMVVTDWELCSADGACIEACPYGMRFSDPGLGNRANACDLCTDRLEAGLVPACVEACPSRARLFGDMEHPEGEFAAYLASTEIGGGGPRLAGPDGEDAKMFHVFYVV